MAAPARNAPAPDQADDPLSSAENRSKLEAAKEFAFHLAKGIKNIGIYRHNTGKYPEYVGKAYEAVQKFTSQFGPMSIKVEAQCFSMFKQPIFEADSADNLPYKFYSDGIRHLIFRPELSLDEFLKFVLIALSDPKRGEDVLSQMWKGGFENIEYIVVEGFSVGEMNDEEVAVEVDKIVGYLYARLRSDSEDYMRFARVSAEDLEMKLEGVDQMRGVVVAGETADEKYIQKIQEEIKEDEESRLFPKIVTCVFQVIDEGGLTDVDALRDIFVQLLDSMLLQEDFATINALLVKFRAMERDPARAEIAGSLKTYFQQKMGEEQRIRRIGDILASTRLKQPQDVFRYLYSLDEAAVVPLLEVLETIDVPENRQIVCDALAALGKNMPDPFVNRLQSEKSQTVRDMIYVIDKCDFPDKLKYFGETLKNPNLAVRLEVLAILSKSKTEQCRRFIVAALTDQNAQMRIQAAKVLPNMSPEKAMQDLMRLIKSPDFEKREQREKEAVYQALGATNQQGALAHFAALLQQKSLLRRAKL
ncbi:MAG: HEAT repeat domain-containing protein, partial [Myxococcales bacterium]